MTLFILDYAEVIYYADRHACTMATSPGKLNPYKLGLELFRDIERRWNRGQYGPEWEACDDMAARAAWNRETGIGRKKIFEVRRLHSDATFLDEFLTEEFCREQKLFTTEQHKKTGRPVVASREFNEVKQSLLFHFTNGGRPVIELIDANFHNRKELLLVHKHVGVDLRLDWARDVLSSMAQVWRRPVHLETRIGDKAMRLGHDGENPSEEGLEEIAEKQAS